MTVEGIWGFLSGPAGAPDEVKESGVIMLETGCVFGGDAMTALKGRYEAGGGSIRAEVNSWTWNARATTNDVNVLGLRTGISRGVVLQGEFANDEIIGCVSSAVDPSIQVPCVMRKLSELP